MRRLVDLVKLDRLDRLIRKRATGSPTQLAKRLDMSRSSLFELMTFLREDMQAPVQYSRVLHSYVYRYVPKFFLGFEDERLSSSILYDTYGGGIDDKKVFSIDDDSDNVILDDDINFNDLYLDEY
jgi:hypothetical protein